MAKVENTNHFALDRAIGSTGNSLEFKPQRRPSPFRDFPGWGSDASKRALKSAPPKLTQAEASQLSDARSAIDAAFKKASALMKDYVKALENQQNPTEIRDKE